MESHGNLVKNLISDKGPHAVLPKLKRKTMSLIRTVYPENYVETAIEMKTNPPSFINNSMGWGESRAIYEALQSLSPPSVAVIAAGNEFPDKLERVQSQASKGFDAVLVGSFSPKGFVSDFSQSGGEIHILAPSDEYISSAIKGESEQFGGTSGAAPLVTGGLSGFEWLSGYHPSPKESKRLLEKTAIPTLHSHEKPPQNGVGLLNAYKLGMVGKRLKEKCADKGPSCFQREMENPKTYQFEVDGELKDEIKGAFSECSLNEEKTGTSESATCEGKKKAFKKLRQAVLLNPNRKDLWETLSCVYKEGGFSVNGEALDRIALAVDSEEVILNSLQALSKKDETTLGVLRVINGMEAPKALEILNDLSSNASPQIKQNIARMAGEVGGPERVKILRNLAKDDNDSVKKSVVIAAGKIGGPEGIGILKSLAQDESSYIKSQVARVVGETGEPEGIEILRSLSVDPHKNVRSQVAKAAGEVGGPEGIEILKSLAKDEKNDDVKAYYIAKAAGKIGGPEGIEILNNLAIEKSERIKSQVAKAAGEVDGPGGIGILRDLATDDSDLVKGNVARAAGKIGGPEGIEVLRGLATDDSEQVKKDVVKAAGEVGGPEGIGILKSLVQDENDEVRGNVAWIAGKIGGPKGIEILKSLAQDKKSERVKEGVARGAGEIGGSEGIELLKDLAKDDSEWIRESVVKAAAGIGGTEGVGILKSLADDESEWIRDEVVRAAKSLRRSEDAELLKTLINK